jgi:hypothetical protein
MLSLQNWLANCSMPKIQPLVLRGAAATAGPLFIAIALTTSPARLQHLGPTLASLVNQTRPADAILLNLPLRFARTGEAYPDALPAELLKIAPQLHVNRVAEDLGPATKLVPTVRWLHSRMDELAARLGVSRSAVADAVHIVVVDDDMRYAPRMLESMAHTATPHLSECALHRCAG